MSDYTVSSDNSPCGMKTVCPAVTFPPMNRPPFSSAKPNRKVPAEKLFTNISQETETGTVMDVSSSLFGWKMHENHLANLA
jgi:hypothetical protein